jgi:hypothetical protein
VVKAWIGALSVCACGHTGPILTLEERRDAAAVVDAPSATFDSSAFDADGAESAQDSASPPSDADAMESTDATESAAQDSGPPLALVLVDVTAPSHADDPDLEARLVGLGFAVLERTYTSAISPSDDAALIVVSSSAEAAGLNPDLPGQPIPIVVLESFTYATLGMTGPVQDQDFGVTDEATVDIVDTGVAALPAGSVNVYSQPVALNFGLPTASALVIARVHDSPNQPSTFGYASGDMMASRVAPARRVGVFLRTGTIGSATPEGWVLFDSAVRWAVE